MLLLYFFFILIYNHLPNLFIEHLLIKNTFVCVCTCFIDVCEIYVRENCKN